MSEIKVNSIKGVSASVAALSINNTDGTCTANITNNLSNRNLIINGAMQVAQRGTSSTSNGYQTVDRYKLSTSNITHNSTKSQQDLSSSDTGPWEAGFRNYARIALSQAGVVAANSEVEIQQRIEAQNITSSGWNYGSASSNITLQFWFRCSTNQTFYGYFYSFDGTAQIYTFSFTASANNTWTKITKTIPGNSNLTFNNDTGAGVQLKLIPFIGTDSTNNKTLDQWAAYDGANQTPDMASTWLTAGASTFDLTGVQLEVGSVATDFEHRSFTDEYLKCCRYYQNSFDKGSVPGTSTDFNDCIIVTAWNDGNSPAPRFAVEMRAAPTMTIRARSSTTTGQVLNADVVRTASTPQISTKGPTYIGVSSGSANYFTAYTWEADAEL